MVNGERVAWGKPGSYVTLDRKWSDKDKIQFSLPMAFRLTLYKGSEPDFKGKNAYAIEYGPLLMEIRCKTGVLRYHSRLKNYLKNSNRRKTLRFILPSKTAACG